MKYSLLNAGSLVAEAEKMIKPWSTEQISRHYTLVEREDIAYVRLAMNVPLLEDGTRKILIDPGTADFLPARLYQEYDIQVPHSLEDQLTKLGIGVEDITDVIFTHLHFDHASGAFKRVPGAIEKRFPKARYHLLKEHYEYALDPDPFEADSFSTRLFRYADRIHWIEEEGVPGMEFQIYHGHTKGMIVPVFDVDGRRTCFISDLAPMKVFLDGDVFCGYDLDPQLAKKEKRDFLKSNEPGSELILVHDTLNKSVLI